MANTHLVTGGYGFIGSNLVNKIGKLWGADKIVVLDPVKEGVSNPKNVTVEHEHVKASTNDIVERGALGLGHVSLGDFATIFHLGAESHVCNSHEDPAAFFEANVYGTFRLLDALRNVPIEKRPRVVMMSTDEVFGDISKGDEDPISHFWNHSSRHNPRNPYAATKAAADMLAVGWAESFGINLTIVHCCNAFGPHQSSEKLVPRIVKARLAGEPIKLYGDGSQVREWIYVDDVCDGLMKIATMGRAAGKRVALSTGMRVANKSLVEVIDEVMKAMRVGAPKADIVHTADRPKDDMVYGLVPSPQLQNHWRPKTHLGEGLKKTVEWFTYGKVTEDSRPKLILPTQAKQERV